MSANHSLVLFEGDVTQSLPEIFSCFGLRATGTDEVAKGLAEIWEYTNWPRRGRPKNVIHKGVLYNGTWTAVLDREMNIITDQEHCEICAKKFGIKIFGYMIESVSGSCALYLYAPGKVRGLDIQNYEILEDFGEPLPQEAGITTEEILQDGAMRISRRIGFSDALFAHPSSKVHVVGFEDPMRSQILEKTSMSSSHSSTRTPTSNSSSHSGPATRPEKPWWKRW